MIKTNETQAPNCPFTLIKESSKTRKYAATSFDNFSINAIK